MKALPILVLLGLSAVSMPSGRLPADTSPYVTEKEAHELAALASAVGSPNTPSLPGFSTESYANPFYPKFYFVAVEWNGYPNGSFIIGHFGIDRGTGDVWNAVICEHYRSVAIESVMARIRARIAASGAKPAIAQPVGPECEDVSPIPIVTGRRQRRH